jgi:hypothetical protein
MLELLGPAMSITTAALLAQSSLRSWRAENKFLKWGGTVLSALFSGAVSLISVIIACIKSSLQADACDPTVHQPGILPN